mgnify:CR=1 FL=1
MLAHLSSLLIALSLLHTVKYSLLTIPTQFRELAEGLNAKMEALPHLKELPSLH